MAHIGASDGPYRLRGASDTAWAAQGYSKPSGFGAYVGVFLSASARTIVPILFLSMAIAAIYLYMDRTLALWNGADQWFTVSHLLVPVAFLIIHLTNRRYGPSYAFAQILGAIAVCAALVFFDVDMVKHLLPVSVVPGAREALSFLAAFFVASLFSIIVFDATRGPRWWLAPLSASVVAGFTFVAIYYPAAFAGTDAPWVMHMAIYSLILVGAAFVGLIPYWFLRAVLQPLSGFGGY